MHGKKSFILYSDYIHLFEHLSDKEAGVLFKIILQYVNGEDPKIDKLLIRIAFAPIKQFIDWQNRNKKNGHWNWKGGISPINKSIRNGTEIKCWRLSVFQRDRYTCKKCGKIGGDLHCHHIKPFSKFPHLRVDINNGLTLCKACHRTEHSKKEVDHGQK